MIVVAVVAACFVLVIIVIMVLGMYALAVRLTEAFREREWGWCAYLLFLSLISFIITSAALEFIFGKWL